ncbi:hypothetical protein IG631_22486 [Alternaria alternata]|jgi:hypothetical protein|nr:hypothetical protein IG631_22486 [Alternaria alternata]
MITVAWITYRRSANVVYGRIRNPAGTRKAVEALMGTLGCWQDGPGSMQVVAASTPPQRFRQPHSMLFDIQSHVTV